MKKLLLYISLIVPAVSHAQKKKLPPAAPPTEKEYKIWEKSNQCLNSGRYNAEQRRAFFPFNTAASIKIVSFSDSVRIYTPLGINNFAIDYNKVIESKELSNAAIDSLTDIFYNVGFTPIKQKLRFGFFERSMCIFQPRNAILFMDANGKVTQFIELCFTCQQYYLSSRKIRYAVNCEQKYDLLRKYFLSQGIKYGAMPLKQED